MNLNEVINKVVPKHRPDDISINNYFQNENLPPLSTCDAEKWGKNSSHECLDPSSNHIRKISSKKITETDAHQYKNPYLQRKWRKALTHQKACLSLAERILMAKQDPENLSMFTTRSSHLQNKILNMSKPKMADLVDSYRKSKNKDLWKVSGPDCQTTNGDDRFVDSVRRDDVKQNEECNRLPKLSDREKPRDISLKGDVQFSSVSKPLKRNYKTHTEHIDFLADKRLSTKYCDEISDKSCNSLPSSILLQNYGLILSPKIFVNQSSTNLRQIYSHESCQGSQNLTAQFILKRKLVANCHAICKIISTLQNLFSKKKKSVLLARNMLQVGLLAATIRIQLPLEDKQKMANKVAPNSTPSNTKVISTNDLEDFNESIQNSAQTSKIEVSLCLRQICDNALHKISLPICENNRTKLTKNDNNLIQDYGDASLSIRSNLQHENDNNLGIQYDTIMKIMLNYVIYRWKKIENYKACNSEYSKKWNSCVRHKEFPRQIIELDKNKRLTFLNNSKSIWSHCFLSNFRLINMLIDICAHLPSKDIKLCYSTFEKFVQLLNKLIHYLIRCCDKDFYENNNIFKFIDSLHEIDRLIKGYISLQIYSIHNSKIGKERTICLRTNRDLSQRKMQIFIGDKKLLTPFWNLNYPMLFTQQAFRKKSILNGVSAGDYVSAYDNIHKQGRMPSTQTTQSRKSSYRNERNVKKFDPYLSKNLYFSHAENNTSPIIFNHRQEYDSIIATFSDFETTAYKAIENNDDFNTQRPKNINLLPIPQLSGYDPLRNNNYLRNKLCPLFQTDKKRSYLRFSKSFAKKNGSTSAYNKGNILSKILHTSNFHYTKRLFNRQRKCLNGLSKSIITNEYKTIDHSKQKVGNSTHFFRNECYASVANKERDLKHFSKKTLRECNKTKIYSKNCSNRNKNDRYKCTILPKISKSQISKQATDQFNFIYSAKNRSNCASNSQVLSENQYVNRNNNVENVIKRAQECNRHVLHRCKSVLPEIANSSASHCTTLVSNYISLKSKESDDIKHTADKCGISLPPILYDRNMKIKTEGLYNFSASTGTDNTEMFLSQRRCASLQDNFDASLNYMAVSNMYSKENRNAHKDDEFRNEERNHLRFPIMKKSSKANIGNRSHGEKPLKIQRKMHSGDILDAMTKNVLIPAIQMDIYKNTSNLDMKIDVRNASKDDKTCIKSNWRPIEYKQPNVAMNEKSLVNEQSVHNVSSGLLIKQTRPGKFIYADDNIWSGNIESINKETQTVKCFLKPFPIEENHQHGFITDIGMSRTRNIRWNSTRAKCLARIRLIRALENKLVSNNPMMLNKYTHTMIRSKRIKM